MYATITNTQFIPEGFTSTLAYAMFGGLLHEVLDANYEEALEKYTTNSNSEDSDDSA